MPYSNGHLAGTGVNTTAIVENENAIASSHGIDAWAFDTYLPPDIVHAADPSAKYELLQAGFNGYMASSNKSLMKYWVTLIMDNRYGVSYPASNEWKYLDNGAWGAWLADKVADSQYLYIQGKPVIGLYNSGVNTTALTLARWQNLLAPIGGQSAVFCQVMNGSASTFNTFGCQGAFTYGVNNLPSSSGHVAYSVLGAADAAGWDAPLPGSQKTPQLTPVADRRGIDYTPLANDTFSDQPTQPEWYSQVSGSMNRGGIRQIITIWNELAEEGPGVIPTVQEGYRYVYAFKWARTHSFPTAYTYSVDAYSLVNQSDVAIATNGTWTYAGPVPGVPLAHDHDEVISTATGDYKQLTHVRMTACSVYYSTGPDRGIAEIDLDGVYQGTVDQYAASIGIAHYDLTMSKGTHVVKVLDIGSKNGASSSTHVGVDEFRVTYDPKPPNLQHVGAANDNGMAQVWCLPQGRERRRRRRRRAA